MIIEGVYSDFRERNAVVAQKWAALSEDNRKEWAMKAEAVCSAAIQVHTRGMGAVSCPSYSCAWCVIILVVHIG